MQHHSNYACHSFFPKMPVWLLYYIKTLPSPTSTSTTSQTVKCAYCRVKASNSVLWIYINKQNETNSHKFHPNSWPANIAEPPCFVYTLAWFWSLVWSASQMSHPHVSSAVYECRRRGQTLSLSVKYIYTRADVCIVLPASCQTAAGAVVIPSHPPPAAKAPL